LDKQELIKEVRNVLIDEVKGEVQQINELITENRDLLEGRFHKIESALDAQDIRMKQYPAFRTPAQAAGYKPMSPEEKGFSEYLRKGEQRIACDERKILRIADDPRAGYLAPAQFVAEIIKGEIEFSPVRELARIRPTSREAVEFPKRTGVFAARHVSEIGDRTETEGLTYGLERISTSEMIALVFLSNWQLEDNAFNMEAELYAEFGEQFGVKEGQDFILGSGVSGIAEGLLVNPNVEAVPSGDAETITAESLLRIVYSLKEAYRRNATFLMNSQTVLACRLLKDDYGRFLWTDSLAAGQPARLLGYPVREAVDMPAIAASSTPILFGDFRRGYIIADRIDVSVQRLTELRALQGQTGFLARKRVGGQVVLPEAIKKLEIAVDEE
jgi:HK97 family phage major capsid protein